MINLEAVVCGAVELYYIILTSVSIAVSTTFISEGWLNNGRTRLYKRHIKSTIKHILQNDDTVE